MWEIFWAVLLALTLCIGWLTNLIGVPGNWFNLLAALIYWWLMPADLRVSFGWPVLAIALALAVIGEILEFAAGAMGAAKKGGSKRGAMLAIAGSMLGAIIGAFAGLPIPVVGSVIAVLLFASFGAMGGAVLGEYWKGRRFNESMEIGHAAFWGRLFGTLGKILVGSVMVAVILAALLIR